MSLHPEAQHFVELTSKAPDLDTRTPAENRVASEATRHLMGEKTPVAYVHDVLIKGVPVRIYNPHPNDGPFLSLSTSMVADGFWGTLNQWIPPCVILPLLQAPCVSVWIIAVHRNILFPLHWMIAKWSRKLSSMVNSPVLTSI